MKLGFSNIYELKNYTLYSLGVLLSQFGTVLYTFVMSLYVLKISDSGMFFAINLAISMIPVIFIMPFAGVLADKGNKKVNVVLMDLLSGLLLLLLYMYTRSNELNMITIYLTTFILATFASMFDISLSSAKVNIVGDEKLVFINSTSNIISSVTRILGPLLGGILFAIIDIRIFILLNGISFVLSGVSEVFIDFNYNKKNTDNEKINFINDLKSGYKYVFNRSDIKSVVGIFIAINIAFSMSVIVPLPYIINNVLKLGSKAFGIIQAGFPLGLILGALIAPRIMKTFKYQDIFKYSLGIFSVLIAIFASVLFIDTNTMTTNLYILSYTAIILIVGVLVSCIDIPLITYIQTKTESSYLGRVMAIVISLVKIVTPLAYIISGYLLDIIEVEFVTLIGAFLMFIYFFFIIKNNVDFLEDEVEAKANVLDL